MATNQKKSTKLSANGSEPYHVKEFVFKAEDAIKWMEEGYAALTGGRIKIHSLKKKGDSVSGAVTFLPKE
jgi:hypothetical protein